MHIRSRRLVGLGAALTLGAVVVLFMTLASNAAGSADHVRWDIVSVSPIPIAPPPSVTFDPGGVATAQTPDGTTITLTGGGTFVAPASGGGSNAVTGGGTWSLSTGGSGTYTVTGLVSWEFGSPQSLLIGGFPVIDNIGATTERANGTAVLRIEFSDGTSGVLTVGCHGPGAPPGIFEGIATTKGFTTFYNVPVPPANANTGRTLFHVRS